MMRQPMSGHTSAEMQECIANCTECHAICLAAIQHCLQQGGKHAEASHIRQHIDQLIKDSAVQAG